MLTPEETSTHQVWDVSEPFLQFELFQYFRMSLRHEDCIQHNDSWGLQPTHPPCGPENAMCFLHWQQLVSTTDTSVTNSSTKWIGQRLKLQMPVCMGLECDVYPWGTGPDFSKEDTTQLFFPPSAPSCPTLTHLPKGKSVLESPGYKGFHCWSEVKASVLFGTAFIDLMPWLHISRKDCTTPEFVFWLQVLAEGTSGYFCFSWRLQAVRKFKCVEAHPRTNNLLNQRLARKLEAQFGQTSSVRLCFCQAKSHTRNGFGISFHFLEATKVLRLFKGLSISPLQSKTFFPERVFCRLTWYANKGWEAKVVCKIFSVPQFWMCPGYFRNSLSSGGLALVGTHGSGRKRVSCS